MDRCLDDNALVEFVEGLASALESERIAGHVDQCHACRVLLSDVVRGGAVTDPGHEIGRYRVLRRLGTESSGVVYVAFDGQLHRTVAVKLLRPSPDATGREQRRVQRDARVIAGLEHPNIVTVHDVGVHDEQVFVVTSLIEGPTLRCWLREERRAWSAVVERFLEAGRGLAHAHHAGVIHGDFTPDHVRIDGQGRAVVTDLGWAHRSARKPTTSSDQFALGTALLEALECRAEVPARVRAVLRRSAASEPTERFPSLDGMLLALIAASRPLRIVRGATVFAAVAVVLGGSAWLAWLGGMGWSGSTPLVASGVCNQLASTMDRAWGDPRRDRLRERVVTVQPQDGPGVWASFEARVSGYVAAWRSHHAVVCDPKAGDAAPRLGQLACLEQAAVQLDGVVRLFAESDDPAAAGLIEAASSLPGLSECQTTQTSEAAVFNDPRARTLWFAVARGLGEARANHAVGKVRDALYKTGAVATAVESLGVARLEAEHALLEASLLHMADDMVGALPRAHAGVVAAERARLPALRARGHLLLSAIHRHEGRLEPATQALQTAQAIAEHLSGNPVLRGRVELALGVADSEAWRPAEAREHFERSLLLFEAEDHPAQLNAQFHIGNTLRTQRAFSVAVVHLERARALAVAQFGPNHALSGRALLSLAMTRMALGGSAQRQARVELERAVVLLRSGFAEASPDMLSARLALGNVALSDRDYANALASYSRCVTAVTAAYPDGHLMEGFCRYGTGRVELARGSTAAAVAELERAYASLKVHVDPDSEALSEVASTLVRALREVDVDSARATEILRDRVGRAGNGVHG